MWREFSFNGKNKWIDMYKQLIYKYNNRLNRTITRENGIVEYPDYQISVTLLKGPKGDGDMQAAKRD